MRGGIARGLTDADSAEGDNMSMKQYEQLMFLSHYEKMCKDNEIMKKLLCEIADQDNATAYESAIEAEYKFNCEEWMQRVKDIL